MGLRCVLVFASFFVFASGARFKKGYRNKVKDDLMALERFANSHSLDVTKNEDISGVGELDGETEDGGVITNVTFLANQQTQTAISVNAIFIPHGKNVPQIPGQKYIVATGNMECQ